MSLFPSETTTMNATVYCTRWWIRQRFITRFIQDYNSTYSYHIWYVYVLYSGVMTTTRGGAESWNRGGGYPREGYISLPRTSPRPFFFRKSQRLQEIHSYKHCIFKIHHNLYNTKQFQVSVTRITITHPMDLFQVKCLIHIGYKDNYIIYTSAGVIQWQGDTPA